MGIENEYTCFALKTETTESGKERKFVTVANFLDKLIATCEGLALFYKNGEEAFRVSRGPTGNWLMNGGIVYEDGEALEYASPECMDPEELALVERAGDLIASRISDTYKDGEVFLMKRSSTKCMTSNSTWGAHESYSTSGRLFSHFKDDRHNAKSRLLMSYLTSRLVYAGAGHLAYSTSEQRLSFLVSPRIDYLTQEYGSGTRGAPTGRAILNTRDEPHMSGTFSEMCRLHLILGDMNRSDWSVYLKVGVTALVISYLEDACIEELEALYRTTVFEHPLRRAKTASSVLGGDADALREFLRCIDIQERWRDAVSKRRDILRERISGCDRLIEAWSRTLQGVKQIVEGREGKEGEIFSRRLDWLIKKKVFEARLGEKLENYTKTRRKECAAKEILSLDFSYHRLDRNDFYRHLVECGVAEEMFTASEVRRFVHEPPRGRAATRVAVGNFLMQNGLTSYVGEFDFGMVRLGKPPIDRRCDCTEVPFDDTPLPELLLKIERIVKSFGDDHAEK